MLVTELIGKTPTNYNNYIEDTMVSSTTSTTYQQKLRLTTENIEAGTYKDARLKGTVRLEGKTYPVQDGDIIEFRFNV